MSNIRNIPVITMRSAVVFPVSNFPISVGRERTIKAVEHALEDDKLLAIFTQKDAELEIPTHDDLYEYGVLVRVVKTRKMPHNKRSVVLQGLSRVKMLEATDADGYLNAKIEIFEEDEFERQSLEQKRLHLQELAQKVFDLSPQIPSDASFLIRSTANNANKLSDIVALQVAFSTKEKQELLSMVNVEERVDKLIGFLGKELQVLELSTKIQSKVKGEMDKAQREYFLREQLKAIQKELDEGDEPTDENEDLKQKIAAAKMPEEAEKTAKKELSRMKKMNPSSAEYTVSRTYLDWLVELPWSIETEDNLNIKQAEEILDEDHFGLEKVKKRIIEYLAVRKLRNNLKGPILCLVGPPGVGKTSLAKSVSRAMGRKMTRMSLGGVRDESEIRGHRRTYIGSMPGKIIKSLKRIQSNNPVFVLDEIDKLGSDNRGDPSSALLEVLDPEQNDTFQDHYLDVPFDLSKIMFIATANQLGTIPGPLRDRMEVIEISGYTLEEKLQIAKRYVIPEQVEEHGISMDDVSFPDDGIRFLIESYTREAGVRSLKREIGALCRAVAKEVASETLDAQMVMTTEKIEELRGPVVFFNEIAERTDVSGVATGMAWTAVGGDILFIEATMMKGKGNMKLSGSLGDVMKESVSVASSFLRSTAEEWGIDPKIFETTDFHIHVPSGSIPKDGPSAGVTMLTALVSLLTGLPIDSKLSMTGEATLRGAVLPVGGIKGKVLAAHRAGIKRIILPAKNRKDLPEIPKEIQDELEFHFCSKMQEVLHIAFGKENLEKKRAELLVKLQNSAEKEE